MDNLNVRRLLQVLLSLIWTIPLSIVVKYFIRVRFMFFLEIPQYIYYCIGMVIIVLGTLFTMALSDIMSVITEDKL